MLDQVLKADPGNKGARELKQNVLLAQLEAPKTFRLDLGGTLDSFSKVRDSEYSAFLQLGVKIFTPTDIYFRFDHQFEFQSIDQALGAGIYQKLG